MQFINVVVCLLGCFSTSSIYYDALEILSKYNTQFMNVTLYEINAGNFLLVYGSIFSCDVTQ